jgi:hypothetical protein
LEQFYPPGDTGVPEDADGEALSTPLRERPDAPLGTLIFRAGLLPAETIESALEEGVKTGKRLGEILTDRGLLKETDLARLLAGQKGLEFVTLREQIVDPAAAGLFSEDQARLFRALPFAFEDGVPVVAIADPTDDVLTRNVREALGREDARFVVSVRSELADIVGEVYAHGLAPAPAAPLPAEAPSSADTTGSDPGNVLLGPVPTAPAESPVAEPAPEPHAAPPPQEAPAPEAPAPPAMVGSDPGHGSEGHADAPGDPAVNGHAENGAVPAPVPAPPAPSGVAPAAPDAFPAASAPPPDAPAPVEPAQPAPEFSPPVPQAPEFSAPPAPAPPDSPAPAPATEAPAAPAPPVEPVVAAAAPSPPPVSAAAPVAQPAPQASSAEPVAEPPTEQAAAAPAEEAPAAAPEPQIPPAAPAPTTPAGGGHRLTVRLANGERVDVGAYGELEAAKAAAKGLMAQVAAADGGDWPFVNGRFLKPDTIVSVDIS